MRYLPLTQSDRTDMLRTIGAASIDDLFADVPLAARRSEPLDLPPHQGEIEVERMLRTMAAKNLAACDAPFFCGAGAYRHHIPASVDHLIQRSEFLTSYTPYQPEISQGTLQYLFEFQTQVAMLSGMDIANASMYDGATACAEAVLMANRATKRRTAILSGGLHPQYRAVTETTSHFAGGIVRAMAVAPDGVEDIINAIDDDTACIVVQTPDFFGHLRDLRPLAEAAHARGALLVAVTTEPLALGAILSPGEMGADIFVGEGQSLGVGLNFGGPYLGLFAARSALQRQMPGRLCGETVDAQGRRGYVLTLSAREQHIRREKATSNICTNSGLCCLAFTIHVALLGEAGFTQLALLNHQSAIVLAQALTGIPGVTCLNEYFFNEFTLRLPKPSAPVVDALAAKGILGGVPVSRLIPGDPNLENLLLVAANETNTDADRAAFVAALREVLA
ncbi:MAG: aminomethyl-transferring glycine dehydrogenase subunit GcvPA [Alphaproteobacteria bacterium]|nr:aminomethyl-transferring glycine dehydrogenase subunit GcvPA [Alphaproteobacteria bacterium]